MKSITTFAVPVCLQPIEPDLPTFRPKRRREILVRIILYVWSILLATPVGKKSTFTDWCEKGALRFRTLRLFALVVNFFVGDIRPFGDLSEYSEATARKASPP
jgi:hypothetical protein